jgi:hypothetical protein
MHSTKWLIPHKGMTWWRKKKGQGDAKAGEKNSDPVYFWFAAALNAGALAASILIAVPV